MNDELRRRWMVLTVEAIHRCSDSFNAAADAIIEDRPDRIERMRCCLVEFFKLHTELTVAEVERCADPNALRLLFDNSFAVVNETLTEYERLQQRNASRLH